MPLHWSERESDPGSQVALSGATAVGLVSRHCNQVGGGTWHWFWRLCGEITPSEREYGGLAETLDDAKAALDQAWALWLSRAQLLEAP